MPASTPRRAELADAQELVRLRGLMLQALGQVSGLPDADWRAAACAWFAERLAHRRDRFVAYVIGGQPGERLLACGLAWLDERVPSPTCPNGLRGHVTGMYTEPHARGRGHGRAILAELLGWLQQHGMAVVELHASAEGAPLYRSAGFQQTDYPAMSLRLNSNVEPRL
jgi:GNAT superfamily N-acetyltransferase